MGHIHKRDGGMNTAHFWGGGKRLDANMRMDDPCISMFGLLGGYVQGVFLAGCLGTTMRMDDPFRSMFGSLGDV